MQNEPINQPDYNAPLIRETYENPEIPNVPSPDNPPWGILGAIGIWIASVAFLFVIQGIFVLPYLFKYADLNDKENLTKFLQSDPTALLLVVLSVIPAHLLTILAAWMLVTKIRKYSFRQTLGWDAGALKWWNYLIIFGAIIAIGATVEHFYPATDNDLEKMLRASPLVAYSLAFLATFTAPLVEEVIYRGVLYSAFRKKFGVTVGVIVATTLFALVHVPQYYPSYSTIFMICLLSLILTLIRAKTKNLLPCIIFHTIFNGVQAIVIVVTTMSSTDSPLPPPEQAATFFKLFW